MHVCVCSRNNDVKKNDVRRNDVRVLQTPSSLPCARANSCNERNQWQTINRKRVTDLNTPGPAKAPTLAAVCLERAQSGRQKQIYDSVRVLRFFSSCSASTFYASPTPLTKDKEKIPRSHTTEKKSPRSHTCQKTKTP